MNIHIYYFVYKFVCMLFLLILSPSVIYVVAGASSLTSSILPFHLIY